MYSLLVFFAISTILNAVISGDTINLKEGETVEIKNPGTTRLTQCQLIERQVNASSGFDDVTYKLYCVNKCEFSKAIDCALYNEGKNFFSKYNAYAKFESMFNQTGSKDIIDSTIDSVIKEFWKFEPYDVFVKRLEDLWVAIMPIALLLLFVCFRRAVASDAWNVAVGVGLIVIIMATNVTVYIKISTILMTSFVIFSAKNSEYLWLMGIVTTVCVISLIGSIGLKDLKAQFVLSFMVILFVAYITYKCLRAHKSSESAMALFTICIGIYVIAFADYVWRSRAINNLYIDFLTMYFKQIVPYGKVNSLLLNTLANALVIKHWADKAEIMLDSAFFIMTYVVLLLLFLFIRALISWCGVPALHKSYNAQNLLIGLYIYCIDVFQPTWFISNLFNGARWNRRRVFYTFLVLIMDVAEYHYAFDFFVLRLILWSLDKVIIESGYLNMARLLNDDFQLNVDKFPKPGAMPWFDVNYVNTLTDFVVRVVGKHESVLKSGVGFIRTSTTTGSSQLITVDHVLSNTTSVKFSNSEAFTSDCVKLGDGDDPCVAVNIKSHPGSDISFLSKSERKLVASLLVIHPDRMLTFIDKEKFSIKDNEISAIVNVRKGDSGSPVFALLTDGTFRFAGTVSRGTFDHGTGNLISSVKFSDPRDPGSPGNYHSCNSYSDPRQTNMASLDKAYEILVANKEDSDKVLSRKDDLDDKQKKREYEGFKKRKKERRKLLECLIDVSYLHDREKDMLYKAFDENAVKRFNFIRASALNANPNISGFVRPSGAGLGWTGDD